ncbi:MAG: DUF4364 family protein [Clostridia bacterium]
MLRRGFIRSKDDIKFLILFSLTFVNFPINWDRILDICTWCDEGFDYFEFNDAFLELIKSEHLEKHIDNNHEFFIITQKGIDTANAFEKRLPVSIRELASISALRVTREIRREACIVTKTTKRAENDYVVTMEMEDIFSIDFTVVSESQGKILEMQFKENAEKIYNDLLNSLVKNYDD